MRGRLGLTTGVMALITALTTGLTPATVSALETAQPSAHAWVTTVDGAQRLSDQGDVPFHAGGSTNLTITVDPSRAYQNDGRFRRVNHRLLGARALQPAGRRP